MKPKGRSRRTHSHRRNLRAIDLLDKAGDCCASIAALAQLLTNDPSEAVNRIGTLLYREASTLHESLVDLERHKQPKRKVR